MPRAKITGTASGHKVLPKAAEEYLARTQIEAIMREAKVSEEDALWLVRDGYWGRVMHTVRMGVAQRNSQREELTVEDDG